MDEAGKAAINAMNALGRPASPEDCARVVGFLASPESDYLNGVVLPIDAGSDLLNGGAEAGPPDHRPQGRAGRSRDGRRPTRTVTHHVVTNSEEQCPTRTTGT